MTAFWSRKNNTSPEETSAITWDTQAQQSIDQAVAQAPVPGLLKGKIKKELALAAEDEARKSGRAHVTAEDVVAGMLAKMPAAMRDKVTAAMQKGPNALKNLEKDLRNQK